MRWPRLAQLQPRLRVAKLGTAVVPKRTNAHYLSREHRTWRQLVVTRAGGRCEYVECDKRCQRSEANGNRMFAHHIVERADGGAPLDPANGMCVCGSHHTLLTSRNRALRHAAPLASPAKG